MEGAFVPMGLLELYIPEAVSSKEESSAMGLTLVADALKKALGNVCLDEKIGILVGYSLFPVCTLVLTCAGTYTFFLFSVHSYKYQS